MPPEGTEVATQQSRERAMRVGRSKNQGCIDVGCPTENMIIEGMTLWQNLKFGLREKKYRKEFEVKKKEEKFEKSYHKVKA